jgi:branched-chain amino acid transport system permease protein
MGISFELLALQFATGLALGSIFVLVGLGLSLIFGMLHVVNFAHGSFFLVGAYVGVYLYSLTGNFWLSLVGVPIWVGIIGMVVERVLIRPLYGRHIDYTLILTFGLSWIMLETIRIMFGFEGIPFRPPAELRGAVDIGVGFMPRYRLFLIVLTLVIILALWLFLEKTSYGLIIRAGARDPEILGVLGFNIRRIWLLVFGMGTAMAGIAGYLAGPIQEVRPEMGIPVLAQAFVVTVVGGMGSLVGSVVAGFLVGVVVAMTAIFVPHMAQVSMFVVMAVVLLLRPQGLFGRKGALG